MPESAPSPLPRRSLRRVIAENPVARRRVGQVYAEFLAVLLVAIAGLAALVLWHLARRGRLIRHRLGQPRPVIWPETSTGKGDDDQNRNQSHP